MFHLPRLAKRERSYLFIFISLLGVMFGIGSSASAQDSIQGTGEFSLSIGYAQCQRRQFIIGVELAGRARKFDPVLSFAPIKVIPQFRLGLSAGTSLVLDNSQRTFVFNNGGTTITGLTATFRLCCSSRKSASVGGRRLGRMRTFLSSRALVSAARLAG